MLHYLSMTLALLACTVTPEVADSAVSSDVGTPDDPDTECNEANEGCTDIDACDGVGAEMLPGSNCLNCHAEGKMGEHDDPALWFSVGGTIFEDGLGSVPAAGAIVHITDASDATLDLTANDAGNFHSTEALVYPIEIRVEYKGALIEKGFPIAQGDCAACHTCDGAAGAKLRAGPETR